MKALLFFLQMLSNQSLDRNDGIVPALWVGAAVLATGSLISLLIPRERALEGNSAGDRDGDVVAQLEAA